MYTKKETLCYIPLADDFFLYIHLTTKSIIKKITSKYFTHNSCIFQSCKQVNKFFSDFFWTKVICVEMEGIPLVPLHQPNMEGRGCLPLHFLWKEFNLMDSH